MGTSTLFTLRWLESPALRKLITAALNKGESLNTLRRTVALHCLGRFRDRSHENQSSRAAALNLVVAAIVLFNCRYLGRVLDVLQSDVGRIDPAHVASRIPSPSSPAPENSSSSPTPSSPAAHPGPSGRPLLNGCYVG